MRASYLAGRHLKPGTVVAWQITAGTRLRTAFARPDHRPLTADQLSHFQHSPANEPGVPEVAPWIGTMCELPNANRESVATMLELFFNRHETLRCIFTPHSPDGSTVHRRLLDPGMVKFEPVVLGTPRNQAEAYDLVAGHLAREARCNAWPYSGIVTIEHAEGTTIIAAFDHITFDGYSLFVTVDDFQRLHAEGADTEEHFTGSHLSYAGHESALTAALDVNDEPIAAWARSLDSTGRLPSPPIEAGLEGPAPHEFGTFDVGSSADSSRFVNFCRSNRVPAGLGFTALLVHSAFELQESRRFDALMSTHNRMLTEWHRSVGWYAGVAPISVEADPSGNLLDTMRRTAQAWMATESAGIVRLPLVNERLQAAAEPGIVISYLDGRRIPGHDRWADVEAKLLLGPVAPSQQVHLWINAMPEGLLLEARYPIGATSTAWVTNLADRMKRNLRTVTETVETLA